MVIEAYLWSLPVLNGRVLGIGCVLEATMILCHERAEEPLPTRTKSTIITPKKITKRKLNWTLPARTLVKDEIKKYAKGLVTIVANIRPEIVRLRKWQVGGTPPAYAYKYRETYFIHKNAILIFYHEIKYFRLLLI